MILVTMQTTRIIAQSMPTVFFTLTVGTAILCSSCGAPDPSVQKQMDKDIMSAGQKKGPGKTTGPQYMQGSQGYGLGGY